MVPVQHRFRNVQQHLFLPILASEWRLILKRLFLTGLIALLSTGLAYLEAPDYGSSTTRHLQQVAETLELWSISCPLVLPAASNMQCFEPLHWLSNEGLMQGWDRQSADPLMVSDVAVPLAGWTADDNSVVANSYHLEDDPGFYSVLYAEGVQLLVVTIHDADVLEHGELPAGAPKYR
jgi:hypothetical protein